jgi:hypothetical protein
MAPPPPPPPPATTPAPSPAPAPAPAERSGRGRLLLVGAVLVALLAAGVGVGVLLGNRGGDAGPTASDRTSTHGTQGTDTAPSSPATGATTPTSPATADDGSAAPDPLGVGYPQRNLACDSGYIVVLTSAEGSSPATTVQDALDRFPRATGRAYLDPARSCRNLSHLTNKVNLARVPYVGPYPDAVSACEARMDVADTTTYVIGVAPDATTATYCACSYDDAALPALNSTDDSSPQGDDRFWTLELQYMLYDAGYNPRKLVPGRYGAQTTGFVSALQGDSGLDRTGAMDAATWQALKSRAC